MHPDIKDAAVIGIDMQDGRGELPRAYLVPTNPEMSFSEEHIMAFMGQRLARYKALAGGIVCVKAIPRNPSGKILKRVLRERAKKELYGDAFGYDAITIEAANKFVVQSIAEVERSEIRIAG